MDSNQIFNDNYYNLKATLVLHTMATNLGLDHKTFSIIFWIFT